MNDHDLEEIRSEINGFENLVHGSYDYINQVHRTLTDILYSVTSRIESLEKMTRKLNANLKKCMDKSKDLIGK